jgi:hypothetical protein
MKIRVSNVSSEKIWLQMAFTSEKIQRISGKASFAVKT